ncbi:tetratricopeptide repeat protein [Crocinitomix catalasitica]|nr:tetratricopeptide repeat protein [Crocinitomix catalasitica]
MKTIISFFVLISISVGFLSTSYASTRTKTDSLKKILAKSIDDTVKVITLNQLSEQLWRIGEFKQALGYSIRATDILEDIPFNQWNNKNVALGHAYKNKGVSHYYLGQYSRSFENYINALRAYEKTNNQKGIAAVIVAMGLLDEAKGRYFQALKLYLKALAIYEEISHIPGIGSVTHNIGNIYYYQEDYTEALIYYAKSLEIKKDLNDKSGEARAYSTIGMIYRAMKNDSIAMTYYSKALTIHEEMADDYGVANLTSNIGSVYADQKDNTSALSCFMKSLKTYEQIGDKLRTAQTLINIGQCYVSLNEYKKGEKYLKKGQSKATEIGSNVLLKHSCQVLADMYEKLGDFERAYQYHQLYTQYKDSLLNESTSKEIGKMEAQYQYDKATALQELEQEKKDIVAIEKSKVQTLKLSQRNYLIAALIGLLLLLGIIAWLILRGIKLRNFRRIHDLEQKALRAQMNPHFTFNTMNSIQHYITANDRKSAQKYISKFARLVRQILENSEHNYITINEEVSTLELYLELESLRFENGFDYKIILDHEIDPGFDRIPPMLLQPYIENAIWHGLMHKENNCEVSINMSREEELIKCTIEDNGVGRKKAGELSKNSSGHRSMGMDITTERLDILNAKKTHYIEITDLEDGEGAAQGTRIEIMIPIG